MARTLGAAAVVGGVLLWLTLAYLPVRLLSLDMVFQGERTLSMFRVLLVVCSGAFIAVQAMLLRTSFRFNHLMSSHQADSTITLNIAAEVFWTALPMVMTIGLVSICYRLLAAAGGP